LGCETSTKKSGDAGRASIADLRREKGAANDTDAARIRTSA
jgi:hypothetical protein